MATRRQRAGEGVLMFFFILICVTVVMGDLDNCGQCDSRFANIDGDNFTAPVAGLTPTEPAHFTTKEYVDTHVNGTEWLQNGFPNRINSSISWSDGGMRFTINPSGASFDYFMGGMKYTVNTSDVENVNYINITDTEGDWWIYYDDSTLTATRAPNHATIRDIYENKAAIAVVFWDADNNKGQLMEDRHGSSMSPITHVLIHQTVGTRFDNGLALNNITTDQDGSADSHAQFGVEAGQIFDEDIEHTLNAVGSTTGLQIWYMDASGWAFTTNAGFSMVTTGTGRLAYDNAGTLTEVTNGDFVLAHVFATGFSHNNPVVAIGQAQYSTKKLAQEGALSEIVNILSIANIAPELKPIASVIFQTKNTFSNSVKAIIVSTDTGGDYVDFRTDALNPAFSSAQDHGNLAGLGDDDHTQYLLVDGSRNVTDPFTFNDNVTILGHLKGGSPLKIAGGLNLTDDFLYGNGGYITNVTAGAGNRMITPSYTYPSNADTAGINFVYWVLGIIYHGKNSLTNNAYCRIIFQLPDDYTSGEDITFRTWWRNPADITGETEVIDYKIGIYRLFDENSVSLEQTIDNTWSGLDNGRLNMEEVTITGTNFNAGDALYTLFYMEDDDNAVITQNWGSTLIIPVDYGD